MVFSIVGQSMPSRIEERFILLSLNEIGFSFLRIFHYYKEVKNANYQPTHQERKSNG